MIPTVSLIAVHTTVGQQDEARRLARTMVEMKLAACAQVSAIESFYAWEGATQQDAEWRIVFKTSAHRYADLEAALRERHPYQLPAIYAVPVAAAFGPYADWVAQEVATQQQPSDG